MLLVKIGNQLNKSIRTHMNTYVHICKYTSVYICISICLCIHIFKYVCACIRAYLQPVTRNFSFRGLILPRTTCLRWFHAWWLNVFGSLPLEELACNTCMLTDGETLSVAEAYIPPPPGKILAATVLRGCECRQTCQAPPPPSPPHPTSHTPHTRPPSPSFQKNRERGRHYHGNPLASRKHPPFDLCLCRSCSFSQRAWLHLGSIHAKLQAQQALHKNGASHRCLGLPRRMLRVHG